MTETTAITKSDSKHGQLRELLQAAEQSIRQIAPKHCSPERMWKVAFAAYTTTPALKECSNVSIVQCVVEASKSGLEIGRHAHLVPFWNKHTKKKEAKLIVDYRGLIDLCRRSGTVSNIEARAVFKGEEFEFYHGTDGTTIVHKPNLDAPPPDADQFRGAYMIARLADGTRHVDYMSKLEIDAIRARSQASSNGPWVTDYVEMAKKTVVRRGTKMLDQSPEMIHASQVDSDRLDGIGQATFDPDFAIGADTDGLPPPDDKPAGAKKVENLKKQLQKQESAKQPDDDEALSLEAAGLQSAPADPIVEPETEPEPAEPAEPPGAETPAHAEMDDIVQARFQALCDVIKDAPGMHADAPEQIVRGTVEHWLKSKKWGMEHLEDTKLWKIIFNAAKNAKFREIARGRK